MKFKPVWAWAWMASALVVSAASAAEVASAGVTVLVNEQAIAIESALDEGNSLWVPLDQIERINGFSVKPQGLCRAEVCIPVRADDPKLFREKDGEKLFNVEQFAGKIGQAVAADREHKVWSFGPATSIETTPLADGKAPDFAVPDRTGKIVHLSDFRGKKVMLLAWASW